MEWLFKKAEEFLRRHKFIRRWRKVLAVMMAMVVFMSTYAMVLPAITLETGEGAEIGLFADTSGDESVPDGSTVTDSIPEAGAEGAALTTETAVIEDTAPAETAPVENVPTENAPAENTPAEPEATETAPTEAAPTEAVPTEAAPTEAIPTEAAPTSTETPAPKVENLVTPEEPKYLENEKLTFENNSIKLTLTVPAAAKVVKGAAIDVREIGQPFANDGLDENGRKNEYLSYLAAAETALNLTAEEITYIEKNIVNTPAAELPWARFFAISIKNADGAITPACALPVEIIYKNTAETAADGLKVMCLLPNGTMTMIGSETKVATAAQTPIALLSAADSNFDITSKFVDAGTLTFGTFAVQISEIDAAIEKEKEEAAKAAAEAAKAESATTSDASAAESVESIPTDESAAESADESQEESLPADESLEESLPADESTDESLDESLPADESADESLDESLPEEAEDESLSEEAEKAEDETEAEEESKADDKATKTLVTKGADYTVTMTYTADAKIPAGAVLSAKEILPTAYNYKGYMNKAVDALGLSEDEAAYARARFFDIKIMLGTVEVIPEAPVRVDIEYTKPQELASAENMKAVHFGNEGPEEVAIADVTTDATTAEVSGVAFEAAGFSVYGFLYTVDFTYDGYTYSIDGEHEITLAALFEALGIQADTRNVENVSVELIAQKDENVDAGEFYVKKGLLSGWVLKSDMAFHNVYALTVVMNNGTKYVISVTDISYDLRDAVKSVTVSGLSGSTWTVKKDEVYTVNLEFEETPSVVQFPTTSNTLTYTLPHNFKPLDNITDKPMTLTYTEKSVSHTLTGCTFTANTDGTVTVTLTDEAKEKLSESGDGHFRIDISGYFTESDDHTDFGGGNVKDITVDDTKDVTVTKNGKFNAATNQVDYTVTVKAEGSLTNVNVKDVVTGTALKIDTNSVQISGNSSTPTGSAGEKGFNYTFPSMKHGETITITYSANVDWDVIGTGTGEVEQTGNNVSVKPQEIPETKTVENNVAHEIKYNAISKSTTGAQDTVDPDTKLVPWTITVNSQGLKDMQNTTLTDTISSGSPVKYVGDGIYVQKYQVNNDGSTTALGGQTLVTWGTLGIDPDTAKTWSYKITDSGKFMYVITYDTEVDVTGNNGNTTITNTGTDDKGGYGQVTETVGPGSSKIGVTKTFEEGQSSKKEMAWTVTMDVPAGGLDKAVLIDTLPTNGTYTDTLIEDSLNVTNLTGDEKYALTPGKGKFTLTFYKDADMTNPGLIGTGQARQITVTFKTKVDESWVALDRNAGHQNNVEYKGDNASVTDNDVGRIKPTGIEKTAKGYKTITINGTPAVVFEYTLDLFGVTETDIANGLSFTDDYDENYLDFLNIGDGRTYEGIDTWWTQVFQNGYNGGEHKETKFVPQKQDGKLVFNVTNNDLPRDNGNLYPQYQIRYYLVALDSTKLLNDSLKESDRTLTIANSAKWGESDSEVTTDYSYPGLVKDNIIPTSVDGATSVYDAASGKTGFKIVINPDKLTLNNGNVMELVDEYTDNLSVEYSTIKITVEPAEGVTASTVTYDYKGNKGIYKIPDRCKVTITYDARVIGTNENVHYGNKVTMNGFTDEADGTAWVGGSGEGGFNVYSVMLYKYSAGHMEQPIEGAVFTMVDEHGNPVVYPEHATNGKAGQPITFPTEEDGYVEIKLNEQIDGISLQKGITYYLKETYSPATHAINNTTYRFTISDNPDYNNYEYHSGDIVKVYDWPIQGRIEIKKTIEGPSDLTEEDKEKIKFEVTGIYDDGTPVQMDEFGYPISKSDLAALKDEERAALKDYKVEITYADFEDGKYILADLVDGSYTVKETAEELYGYGTPTVSNTMYQVDTDGVRVDENEVQGTTEAVVTITNKSKYVVDYTNTYPEPSGYQLKIKKVHKNSGNTTALYGAVFKLEKKVGETYQIVTESSVAEDGTFSIPYANKDTGVTLNGLTPGEYRITEIEAPTNYKVTGDGIVEFTIADDGTVTTTSGNTIAEFAQDTNSEDSIIGTYTIDNDNKHSYSITKTDGVSVSLKLPGARFGVWASHFPEMTVDDAMQADKDQTGEPPVVYVTDENGFFEIDRDDYPDFFKDNTIYYFKEIDPPYGYKAPADQALNYFFFSYDNGTPPTKMKPVNLGTSSRSQTITNDVEDLKVTKLWKSLTGQDIQKDDIDVDSVEFVVYRTAVEKDANGDVVSTSEETRYPDNHTVYTIEYDNGWKPVTIPNAPSVGKAENGNVIEYTYRVEETVPAGFELGTYKTEKDGRAITLINTPETIEITVKKKWELPSFMDENQANASIGYRIYREPLAGEQGDPNNHGWVLISYFENNQEHWLTKNNQWTQTFKVQKGYTYHIVETQVKPDSWKKDSFEITYSVNGILVQDGTISETGTVEITNTYDEPYLELLKDWQATSYHDDLAVYLNIYRRNVTQGTDWELWYGENQTPNNAKLDQYNHWYLRFEGEEDLDTGGDTYEYYVEEYKVEGGSTGWGYNAVGNYYVTYSHNRSNPMTGNGTITVTNSDKYDGELTVDKVWKDSLENELQSSKVPNTVKVVLQRAVTSVRDSNRVTLTVNLTNGKSKSQSLFVPNNGSVTFTFEGGIPDESTWTVLGTDSEVQKVQYGKYQIALTDISSPTTVTINQGGGADWNTLNTISS